MEIDADKFMENVFNNSPKEEKKIGISFIKSMELDELFEFLLMTFTKGTKILFGDEEGKVNLAMCTDREYNLMNKYFASFGFKLELDRYDYPETELVDFDSMSYKNIDESKRKDMKLQDYKLPLRCNRDVFVIYFFMI